MASTYMDIIRYAIEEAWNKGNLDVLDQVYASDCVSHEVSPGGVDTQGIEVQKEHLRRQRATLPDFHVAIEDMFCAGDKVAFRWVVGGTHKGRWMGIAPTGKQITWGGITICRFANGKIQEEWLAPDMFSALLQLGVLGPIRRAEGPPRPPQLELLEHRGRRFGELDRYHYVIEGQVKNVSHLTLVRLEAVARLYDKDDKLLSSERSFLASEALGPGEVSPFRVRVVRVAEPFMRYEIWFERDGARVEVRDTTGSE